MLNESAFRKTGRCVYYEGFLASKKVHAFPLPEVDSNMINESDLMTKSEFHMPFVIKGVSNKLDIKVPANGTTLTEVAEVIGHSQPIKIIEVGEQSEITGKTLGEYANYLKYRTTAHKVINMISLEFSSTPLNAHIHAPKFVREIDWIDNIWPLDRRSRGDYPQVQKYCLSGMATSYTDFHIDFGGTSVWYHVVTGQKRFYLVAPTVRNLLAFQKWSTSTTQSEFFFGDLLENKKECFVYDLHPGDTFMIPSGWIHSVYTPKDSLVFGGNFLHINAILRQLQVYQIEANTRVHKQYRFPLFRQINWYVLCSLLPVIKTMYRTHSTEDTKEANGTDNSSDFSQYEDEVVSIARTVRKPSLFNQLPLLVKVAGEWVDSMTDPAEIDIYLATAKDTARCVDAREVLTQWWEVLSVLAKTLDADGSAASEVSACTIKSDEPAASSASTLSMSYAEYVAFLHSAPSPINLLDTATVGRALLPFDAEIGALYAGLGITHHSNNSSSSDSNSSGGGATSSASQSTEHSGVVTFSQHNALSKAQSATSAEDSSLTLKLRHNNLKRTLKLKPDPLSDLNGDDPSVCDSQITIPNTYTTSTLPPEGPSGRKVITTNEHKGKHKRKDDESLTYEETMAQLAAEDGDRDGPEGSDVASDEDDVTEDQSDSNYGGDGGNPAPEEKPAGSSGLRLKFTLSKKETTAGSSTTTAAAAPMAPGVTNGFTVPVYTPAVSQQHSSSIGGNNGVGARSNKSLSLSDYVSQQRGTSSAASTLKTMSYTDNTAAVDTTAHTIATDAHTAGATNESKRKVTLTLLSANKKRQMAEDAKRGPAPPKVSNTIPIQQSSSGGGGSKGNNAIAARIIDESEGQRKYGTRGIKLSATFLQNAMDVDFLDEPQQPSQGSGASVNSDGVEELTAVGAVAAANSDSQAAAQSGTATNAEALRAEMDFLFADDDSADGDFSEEEAFTEEMLDRRAERAERKELDNMESEDEDEDVGFDSGFEEEDEEEALYARMRGNKRGAPSAARAATARITSSSRSSGTVKTAGAKSTNKRRRIDHFNDGLSGIGSLSKPAGRAPTAPPKKEFVVDRVSYNSYMGIAPTAPPIVAATGSFNTNSVASNARPAGGANSWKPLSAFTGSGGATSGAKPVSNRNKILKKLGMK